MTKPPISANVSKSKALIFFEYALFALCLCVIALRVTLTESPTAQSTILADNLRDTIYSLAISTSLGLGFVLWLAWSFCSKRFVYRITGIEISLCLFYTAAVVAGFAASNKRLAIIDLALFLAPLLMAVLLVQILDSHSKVKLLLAVIAALGIVTAYQCREQFSYSNQEMIEQYEQDNQSLLEPLGIESGTFGQFLFEHRLYSRGVRGYFTTRNSAGSFLLMALFAAVALFIDKLEKRKSELIRFFHFLTCGAAIVIILFALALTKSKGAIIGLLFASAVFIGLLCFGNWLRTHRKTVLIVLLLLALAGGCVVVSYGLMHGSLPGGNSMLVRWQYWQASAKIYADHFLTGIGPGNFKFFYTHYKPAEALESVADPHNFLLSVLTQYGPLGLVGFLAMIFIPLWKVMSVSATISLPESHRHLLFKILVITFLIIISVVLLLFRSVFMPVPPGETFLQMFSVILILYIIPVAIFVIGFLLLAIPLSRVRKPKSEPGRAVPLHLRAGAGRGVQRTNINAALLCAVLGVTLHNLIDFAIFEPGVFTTFWAIIACLIVMHSHHDPRSRFVRTPAVYVRALIVIASIVIIATYVFYVVAPVARSTEKIRRANRAIANGWLDDAHDLLQAAAENDSLSPTALSLDGRLYLRHFEMTNNTNRNLLLQSEKCFQAAINRNRAAFKNYERLAEVYSLLAEVSPKQQEKTDWLDKSYDAARLAAERYPGSARIQFELAEIAEKLHKTNDAVNHYENAINIENSFRKQFQIMYPDWEKMHPEWETVSRLGKDKYNSAKERLKTLSKSQIP